MNIEIKIICFKISLELIFLFSLEEIEALEYHNVRIRGTFDHTREFRIGPRRNLCHTNNKQGGGIISSSSSTGYHVVTPFKLADRE